MIRLLEDNTVICGDGAAVNSGHPHKTQCVKGRRLAEAFSYRADIAYDRQDEHVEELSFDGKTITVNCHNCRVVGRASVRKGIRLTESKRPLIVERTENHSRSIDPLDDLSGESDRVKLFASIVFDDDAKAAFIESLPTVDVPVYVDGEVALEEVERHFEAVKEWRVVDGSVRLVEVEPERTEIVEVPLTRTVRMYKGAPLE